MGLRYHDDRQDFDYHVSAFPAVVETRHTSHIPTVSRQPLISLAIAFPFCVDQYRPAIRFLYQTELQGKLNDIRKKEAKGRAGLLPEKDRPVLASAIQHWCQALL